jgi:hypothetical protein
VLADSNPLQTKLATFFGDCDQREVGRTAANVDNENQIADTHLLAPVWIALDPGIERCLRLFQQHNIFVTRILGGMQSQLPSDSIERGGHRDQNRLFVKPSVGMRMVPCVANVFQIRSRCRDRRDLTDTFWRSDGQQR